MVGKFGELVEENRFLETVAVQLKDPIFRLDGT